MTYKIVDMEQGTSQWHEWRKGKIGSSSIATIMGLNPFETALQLYNRILGDQGIPDNAAMAKGRELEPIARDRWNKKANCNYQPVCVESAVFPWMIASLDGWWDNTPLEIKCGEKAHKHVQLTDRPPEYYIPQCQWIMYMMGSTWMRFVSFYNDELIAIIVERDDLFIEKMVACVKEFYNRLINFDPPEPCDRDYVTIEHENAIGFAKEYISLCERIKDLENLKDLCRESLINVTDNRNAKIGTLRLTKVTSKGLVTWKDLVEHHKIDPEPFRGKNRESWRIS